MKVLYHPQQQGIQSNYFNITTKKKEETHYLNFTEACVCACTEGRGGAVHLFIYLFSETYLWLFFWVFFCLFV